LKGFWLTALKNHPAFEDYIEEWDEPVLEYLKDITTEDLDPKESNNGFKVAFVFQDNPYFEEKTLWKEYITKEGSPYTPGDMDMEEIKASPISWRSGMNITVVKTQKKKKCGGKKKTQVTEEIRKSFFRYFFKNLKPGADLPDDIPDDMMDDDESDGDSGQLMEMLIENDHESGVALRDHIIPFAVRWYTGEAVMDDEDEDDEDDESGDSDDEDESEEDDEDDDNEEDHGQQKGASVTKPKKEKEKEKPSQKAEECKQQ